MHQVARKSSVTEGKAAITHLLHNNHPGIDIVKKKSIKTTTVPKPHQRRGAALVEFAIIVPFLLLMLVGSIEIGRGITMRHAISEAARAGARVYSLQTQKTEQDARNTVATIMTNAGLKDYTISFSPNPNPDIKQLDPLTVTVTADFEKANWYHTPWFFKGKSISSQCVMPADLGKSAADGIPVPFNDGTLLTEGDRNDVYELSGTTRTEIADLEQKAAELTELAAKEQAAADQIKLEGLAIRSELDALSPYNSGTYEGYETEYQDLNDQMELTKQEYSDHIAKVDEYKRQAEAYLQQAINLIAGRP